MEYREFLERKKQVGADSGFEPIWMPSLLFDFQKELTTWAIRKGRAAIFADCGLGKTFMQLVWAENIHRKTGKRVLILTPLAVGQQTINEAGKIGVEASICRDGNLYAQHGIVVSNYERLHYFNPDDFVGVVCDESSILKHYTGATQKNVTRFLCKIPYRLLCTATAAPNDYVELGTSSEALGYLTNSEMLTRFFMYCDDKKQKKETRDQSYAEKAHCYYGKLAFRVAQTIGQWRLKNHAIIPFWRWVCSWAKACRMPSDLGFDDRDFILPDLNERHHIIMPSKPPEGYLFTLSAVGLGEEREERKRTLNERCEFVRELSDHNNPVVIWCHLNPEGDLLEELICDSKQVSGSTPDDDKEAIYNDFLSGSLRALVIKPKIGAWGLNWQHCSNVITFASHSYEQYYQSIRRCWRFGQKKPVTVDIIATEGEKRVIENMQRKADQASKMFDLMINEMHSAETVVIENKYIQKQEVPSWLV